MPSVTPTTSWSLISEAAATHAEGADEALAKFCERYWSPVYAFFRRKGWEAETALDLTQGFFVKLIEKQHLQEADPARGRFRTFLFTCAMNYGLNEVDREQAAKRGGAVTHLPLDLVTAEQGYLSAPSKDLSPEHLFHRQWAMNLIEKAVNRLRDEQPAEKASTFEVLSAHLLEGDGVSYREIGERVSMSEGAARVAVHRLRRRFAALLREEIELTVSKPMEVEDELRFLILSVSR